MYLASELLSYCLQNGARGLTFLGKSKGLRECRECFMGICRDRKLDRNVSCLNLHKITTISISVSAASFNITFWTSCSTLPPVDVCNLQSTYLFIVSEDSELLHRIFIFARSKLVQNEDRTRSVVPCR